MGKGTKIYLTLGCYLIAVLFLILSFINLLELTEYTVELNKLPKTEVPHVEFFFYILVIIMLLLFISDLIIFNLSKEKNTSSIENSVIIQAVILVVLLIIYFVISIKGVSGENITTTSGIVAEFTKVGYIYIMKNNIIILALSSFFFVIGDILFIYTNPSKQIVVDNK